MNRLYKLAPHPRRVIWGGERLGAELELETAEDEAPIGESLDASGLSEMPSRIVEPAEAAGKTLDQLFAERRSSLLGEGQDGVERFPLLVKRIDSGKRLSLQVHPDDETARELEGEPNGKSEAWVILEAESDAVIHLGLREGVGREDLKRGIETDTGLDLLRELRVEAGDVLGVPAGCAHAIGGGIYLFEVQQPSDITYRLYDYGRLDEKGRPRPLHIEKGVAAVKPELRPEKEEPQLIDEQGASRRWQLCDMGVFSIERWELNGRLSLREDAMLVIHPLDGDITVTLDDEEMSCESTATMLVGCASDDRELVVSGSGTALVACHRPLRS